MEIINDKERDYLENYGASYISNRITRLLKEKNHVTLGVVGGTSVKGIYSKLSEKELEWDRVHVFMIDERYVPLDHEDSNFRLVKENLKKGNLHPFDHKRPLSNYSNELDTYGNLDIVVLSSGEDGHIGALYPNHHSIKNNFPKFISMGDSPKPPQKRMTASRKMIEKADDGLLLFFGAGKTDAYFKYKLRTNSVEDCPAQICKSYKHGRALVNLF